MDEDKKPRNDILDDLKSGYPYTMYKKRRAPLHSWVYFIQKGKMGPIKIGQTAWTPEHRLLRLQTASAEKLNLIYDVPGDLRDEEDLHYLFLPFKIRGEWFEPRPLIFSFIDYCKKLTGPIEYGGLLEKVFKKGFKKV